VVVAVLLEPPVRKEEEAQQNGRDERGQEVYYQV